MTGAFLRVERDGKFWPIEVEHLTDEERKANFINRDPEELLRWMNMLSHAAAEGEHYKREFLNHCEAASIFQPGGNLHGIARLGLGRSAVVEGIAWLVAERDRLIGELRAAKEMK